MCRSLMVTISTSQNGVGYSTDSSVKRSAKDLQGIVAKQSSIRDRSLADIGPVYLYKKLEALGHRDILTVVGSWGDTLDDEEVFVLE